MTDSQRLRDSQGRYRRPSLERSGPDRRFRGYYRTADDPETGVSGHTVRTREEVLIQAVRMAYRVADEQIERSKRLATSLKQAGDAELGGDSDLKAVDALERLGLKSLLTLLGWAETATAEPGSPIRRLASVQYRTIGRLFGLDDQVERPPDGAGQTERRSDEVDRARSARPAGVDLPTAWGSTSASTSIDIRLKYRESLPVRDLRARLPSVLPPNVHPLRFFSPGSDGKVLDASLTVSSESMVLQLQDTEPTMSRGWWIAAVCDAENKQLGFIELRF